MPEMLLQILWKNHYKVRMQRKNKLLQNLERKYAEVIQTQQWWVKKFTSICKLLPLYKPAHLITKTSKTYDKVTATIRVSYPLHADEYTVFVNKVEQLGLYIGKSKEIIKSKL